MADDGDITSTKPILPPQTGATDDMGNITSTAPPSEHLPLERSPDDSGLIGRAKNYATGALTGMSTLAGGMAGDTVEAAKNIAAGVVSLAGPRSTQDILDMWKDKQAKDNAARIEHVRTMQKPSWSNATDAQWEAQRQRRLDALKVNQGEPPTTQQVYQRTVAPKLGSYEPAGPLESVQQAGVAGAVPGLLGGPTGAAAGAIGGITSLATSHLNPFWRTIIPLAAGASVPTVAKATGAVKQGLIGKNTAAQEAAAAKLLAEQSADPAAALRLARERAGLPDETLAESTVRGTTGDRGLAKAQDTMLTRGGPDDPTVRAVQAGQEGRTAAMTGALQEIGKDSTPEQVSAGFRQHTNTLLKNIEDNPEPAAPPLDESGAAQAILQKNNNQAAKAQLDKFNDTIDPDRKMGFWAGNDKDYAANELNRAKTEPDLKRNPVVDDALTRVTQWPDVKSYRDSVDFVRGLNEDIGQLMKTGNTTAARDLIRLKEQIGKSHDSAVENQHKVEQTLAQRGEINPDDTLASNFQRARDDWLRQRQQTDVGPNRGAGTAAAAGQPEEGVPGVGGATRAVGEGSPDAAGDQGVPGQLEPLSAEAVERMNLYKQGHGARKDLFENSPAAAVTDAADFDVKGKPQAGAAAANAAFKPGPGGFQIAESVLNTGGAEALANMKDIAIGKLQAELKGKPLDQKGLNAFKTKHFDALRAIDEADAKANPGQNRPWSDSFNDAAEARTNLQEFENSRAGKFLGMDSGSVVNHVRGLMQGKDSAPIKDIMDRARIADGHVDNGPTQQGLRRAAAQAFENDFEGKGPRAIIAALRDRRANLDAMFEPENVEQMLKVAENFEKSATAQALARQATPGSQTAPRTAGMENLNRQLAATVGKDVHSGVMDTGLAIATWETLKEAGSSLLKGDIGEAVVKGLGIGAVNIFKSRLERALAQRNLKAETNVTRLFSQGLASREVGAAMLERAINADGTPNQLAIEHMADALAGTEAGQQREGRASGGRVGDHSAAARHMIAMVERARKMDTAATKPLLKVDDHAVATALAAANRSI